MTAPVPGWLPAAPTRATLPDELSLPTAHDVGPPCQQASSHDRGNRVSGALTSRRADSPADPFHPGEEVALGSEAQVHELPGAGAERAPCLKNVSDADEEPGVARGWRPATRPDCER